MDDNSAILGRAFGLLTTGLDKFLTQALDSPNWIDHLRARDAERGITGKTYSVNDPQCALRMFTDGIPPIKAKLASALGDDYQRSRAWASELRETRNSWAHNKSLSDREVNRTLDTIEFLLESAHQPIIKINALRPRAELASDDADLEMTLLRIKAEEGDAAAMMALGRQLETQGSLAAANRWYEKSFKTSGEPMATARLAWLYEWRNDIPRARATLNRMAVSDPLYANQLLGLLAEGQGDLKTAEAFLRKSLPNTGAAGENSGVDYLNRLKGLERVVNKQGRDFRAEEDEAKKRADADARRQGLERQTRDKKYYAEQSRKRREERRERMTPFQRFLDFFGG